MASVRDWRDRLEGKPRIVEELTKINAQIREREGTLRALEENRDKIPADRFEGLRKKNAEDLDELIAQRDPLQREIDDQHLQNLVEKTRIEGELADLEAEQAELERLREIGVLSKADHFRQSTELKMKAESAELQLQACRRLDAQLAPLASPPADA